MAHLGKMCAGPGSRGPGTKINLEFCTRLGNSFNISANALRFSCNYINIEIIDSNYILQWSYSPAVTRDISYLTPFRMPLC